MSQASATDDAEDQRTHNDSDEQLPPQNDIVGPIEEKKMNVEPLAELPSGTSDAGPSRPLGPHEQENTSNVSSVSDLATEAEKVVAEKDQPTLSELANVMKQVLDVLQDSTIALKTGKDKRSRFWGVYKRVAEEHDSEFLEQYTTDMDIVLIFSGLFSAVSTSFIVAMESDLSPDPSDTTNALLKQLVQIGLGNLAEAGSTPVDPASVWSLTAPILWIQTIAYASLSMSLLAAFGAVLGKQWLGYYKSNRYGRGSEDERGKRRQEKFNGLVTWHFDAVVQSFPVLLQISLLLFGIALGGHLWYEQASIAWVIIGTTVFGFLFYSLTVMACLISPACPFQTPISTILRALYVDRVLHLMSKRVSCYFQRPTTSLHGVLKQFFSIVRSGWTRLFEVFRSPVYAIGTFARRSLRQLITRFHNLLRSSVLHSATNVVDSEAQPLDQDLDVLAENDDTLNLDLSDIPTSDLEARSVKWLLETSTDPEVFLAAARLVPQVEWPLDLDVSDMLHQLSDIFMSCVDIQRRIVPSLEEKASACTMALTHLYYGCVLQAYPDHGEFIIRGRQDFDVLLDISISMRTDLGHLAVLDTTMNFCRPDDSILWPAFWLSCPDSVYERLSHLLPYHFVTGRVIEGIENLAVTVISKLLSSPSSPSNQIVANCLILGCVMVGAKVDKKDIVRIDKSSALPRLSDSLVAQFQKALWAWDGGELNNDSTGVARRACKLLDIICRILKLPRSHLYPVVHTIRNLDVCRKIYLQARSSEQNDASVSLAVLRKILHFIFAAFYISRDPAQVWDVSVGLSHSPEDFDWVVDYFDFIYSDDHDYEATYDILLLFVRMEACCSSAKQHLFIERLIACMDSNMPLHIRHAALRAAHIAREEIASIDAIDDADMMTKLSPAILSVLCPHPGRTPANDDPNLFFDYSRDLCYLGLVYPLARNSGWHPYLSGDRHVDRCIGMIPQYCNSESPTQHAFYIAGILLQITSEQTSVTTLDPITEQQWWDVMKSAWSNPPYGINNACYFKILLVLVDATKKYMQIASKSDLGQLIPNLDETVERLEWDMREERRLQEMGQEMQDLEQREGIITAAKELRTAASNMLESFGQ